MTKVLEVSDMDGQILLGRLNRIFNEVSEIKRNFQPKEPTQYMTRREVSELFGVALNTVSDWTKKGLLKSYKIGNRIYYKRHEIDQALTEIRPTA